jgi:uncharacterized membrane protein YesL
MKLRSSAGGIVVAGGFLVLGVLLFAMRLRAFAGFLLIFSAMKFRSSSMELAGFGASAFLLLLVAGVILFAGVSLATTHHRTNFEWRHRNLHPQSVKMRITLVLI